jgi:hypothetical protein
MNTEAVYQGENGEIFQSLADVAERYPVPRATAVPLVAAGLMLGATGDVLMHASDGPVGISVPLWIAAVAAAVLVLHRRAGLALDRERVAWLAAGVLFAAGFAWRDAERLQVLAMGCTLVTFALAAHRPVADWVRRAGVARYAGALACGALHAGTAAILALVDVRQSTPRVETRAARWRSVAAVARGLAIAAPLVAVFGALFMSADAVFKQLVQNGVRLDYERVVTHSVVFAILTWVSTGYMRGFLTGTAPASGTSAPRSEALMRPSLGITEVATAIAAIDLLFLAFVLVQFRYLFGADAVVLITPDLTYADYARRGFFELVSATALVVPILLAADWLLDSRTPRGALVFRVLAGLQIALVMVIAASALQRLRLYHASYGLTESRFYAMALLIWIGAMLLWLAATVLRNRRESFAFGALASGLAMIAVLFVVNPDALIARANVARMAWADPRVRFDVAYATSLSADAVPVLIDALPALPSDVQCPLARHMLRNWSPDRYRSMSGWNWAARRARNAVRTSEAQLRSMTGPDLSCVAPVAQGAR